jgi:hypothetical protein
MQELSTDKAVKRFLKQGKNLARNAFPQQNYNLLQPQQPR